MDAEFWKHWTENLTRIKAESDRYQAELNALKLYREGGEAQAEGVYSPASDKLDTSYVAWEARHNAEESAAIDRRRVAHLRAAEGYLMTTSDAELLKIYKSKLLDETKRLREAMGPRLLELNGFRQTTDHLIEPPAE